MEWVVDADIRQFFDNIPHKLLIKQIKKLVADRKVIALIKRWLDAGLMRRGVLKIARGIPQGAVFSPFFCNVYLTVFDYRLSSQNLPFVRFADDFLVFARSKKDAIQAHIFIRKTLNRLGLQLNQDKTRVVQSGSNFCFLGKNLTEILKYKPDFSKKG